MPVHNYARPAGTVVEVEIDGRPWLDNVLGDPTTRVVAVYLPPGYHDTREDFPLMVDLAGFTGSGLRRLAWTAFGESVPVRVDRLVATGAMGKVIVAFPDGFTRLGGNQYIDSPITGNWASFLNEAVVPALEARFRVRAGAAHRAVFGKSSGGYGALMQGMLHGERWGAVACHSGDMGFEWLYLREFPAVLDALARHNGNVERLVAAFDRSTKVSGSQLHVMMILAMAATYDPQPDAPFGVRLPVDTHTCELDTEAWFRWLEHDPIRAVERPQCQENLRRLAAVFIDCGCRDQYFLHYGARAFTGRLTQLGISHSYQEFDDDHSGIDYRLDTSLPVLYQAIASRA